MFFGNFPVKYFEDSHHSVLRCCVRSLLRSLADLLQVFPSELAAGIIGDGVFPRDKIPLERVGTEEDMAGAILFLTSRAGAYSTGNVMLIDGGRLSILPATY
jgi:hypothetical protein